MKSNVKFQHYKKLSSTKVGFWCFALFGLSSLLLGILVNTLSNFNEYENYEVSGIVENYTKGEEILKIYLKDDANVYYINNIVYDELDEDIYKVLDDNIEIKMHIAYQDEYSRFNISQLEVNGEVYLNMNSSETAEYSNYRDGQIGSFVMIGIGAILEIFGVIYFIKFKKLKRE